MEMGKDVLSLDRAGRPNAFQLKGVEGGRLGVGAWRGMIDQINQLVLQAPNHPSITTTKLHRATLVVNAELEEETFTAIEQYNANLKRQGLRNKLYVIVRGQLHSRFWNLQSEFWPLELPAHRTLLELYLSAGQGPLPRKKLAAVFESVLLGQDNSLSHREVARRVAASSILCALAISEFTKSDNFAAEFEAWIIHGAYVLYAAEFHGLEDSTWRPLFNLTFGSALLAIARLIDELKNRKHLIEGNALVDGPVYPARILQLIGILSAYWFTARDGHRYDTSFDQDREFILEFVRTYLNRAQFWGEYCSPQLLACWLLMEKRFTSRESQQFLLAIIQSICSMYKRGLLPSPYCAYEEYWEKLFNLRDDSVIAEFKQGSYTAESFVHLYSRLNLRQQMGRLWPELTRLPHKLYQPIAKRDYYRFENDRGIEQLQFYRPTKSWSELKYEAGECSGTSLPKLLKKVDPAFTLLFYLACPHRMTSSGARWLFEKLV